jgi:hypothetical protein
VKCFRDAGFPTGNLYTNDVTLDDDPNDDIPLIHLQKKIPFESLDEITDIENTIPTEETYDGDWEKTQCWTILRIKKIFVEYESDEDDEPLLEAKSKTHHTYETLLDLLKEARKFALVEDDTYLDPVQNLITIIEKNIVQQKLSRKRHQSNLDNFVEQI